MKTSFITLLIILGIGAAATLGFMAFSPEKPLVTQASILLDQEHLNDKGQPVTASTQSINRYASVLRNLTTAEVSFQPGSKHFHVRFHDSTDNQKIAVDKIPAHFLLPVLPYKNEKSTAFDVANIVLAEYARNGINLAPDLPNDYYPSFTAADDLFNDEGEYTFKDGQYQPNPGTMPKRMSIVNNCLDPGLWELSAKDAVGEMYHGWMQLPRPFYLQTVATLNTMDPFLLESAYDEPGLFDEAPLELDKLRTVGKQLVASPVVFHEEKAIGSYSNQDGRRKGQRKFYKLLRDSAEVGASTFAELKTGDRFSLHSFDPPGIYNPDKATLVTFTRHWERAEITAVTPKTRYPGQESILEDTYLEVQLFGNNDQEVIVAGNIPLSLLTPQKDFAIPAFGAGVLPASELVERRYLRTAQGPAPAYAYLASRDGDDLTMINNHKRGYEQLYLRPVWKGEDLFLRLTIVSYERITDICEVDIPVPALAEQIQEAAARYQPPIYETYVDDNLL